MNIIDVMSTRRNIKVFKPDVIKDELINKWLQTASLAPNHRMTEPWEIYVIGKETRAKLNHKTNFGDAPFLMAVVSRNGATVVETEENVVATACFIQNFNLAAWAEGVGTFWSSVGITPKNKQILGVTDDSTILGVLGVGYPKVVPDPKPRTPIQNKITSLP
ncbi:nitroreductase family protein [Neobacillus jeddahensis]|uniref:nitroreductase family protein n=1 Tax=Neobacillus jeddahensis TaxID=1461580 RepID=UPI00058B99D6|nr:nitroreductase [Neobacillus jeddahensis]